MQYIYHLRPDPFEGTSLIPLNSMDVNSDLYKRHADKYIGRENLMLEMIPKLNCKWNDVVQFSALNPQIIASKLKEINPRMELARTEYFKIPIDEIVSKYEVAIYERRANKVKGDFTLHSDDVELLTLDNYKELTEVPITTINYWNEVKTSGGNFLWFPYVPHIFVKGIIDTSGLEVCVLTL